LKTNIKTLLDTYYQEFSQPKYWQVDPIIVPAIFSDPLDIEIAGFFSAIIAWGKRENIVKAAKNLMQLMNYQPYKFITGNKKNWNSCESFVYRTFQPMDLFYFLDALRLIYFKYDSLNNFVKINYYKNRDLIDSIRAIRDIFLFVPHEQRSEKHIPNPDNNSACKRINLYFRWMVRTNKEGLDFGIWQNIPSSSLYIPLDLHVGMAARELGLLSRKQNDLKAVIELTYNLKQLDPFDPIKYDLALFGYNYYKNDVL
jgi:uncharacterized protein (TIGR02757 family)